MSVTVLAPRKALGLGYLEGGVGAPLVLLHGIPGSALTWAEAGGQLAPRFRVIIPDLLGFGRSDPPAGDYYMEAQAHRLAALLEHLGVEAPLLGGHDFGGPVALTLHRLYPRLGIRGLVLSSTNLFTDTHVPPPLRLARVPLVATPFFLLAAGNWLGLRLMYQAAAVQRRRLTWTAFRQHLTPSGVSYTRKIFQRSLADLETNYRPIETSLATIAVPTLILWGDRDPFFKVSVAERSHRAIPGSHLVILPHTGHFVPEEQPELTATAIQDHFAGADQGTTRGSRPW